MIYPVLPIRAAFLFCCYLLYFLFPTRDAARRPCLPAMSGGRTATWYSRLRASFGPVRMPGVRPRRLAACIICLCAGRTGTSCPPCSPCRRSSGAKGGRGRRVRSWRRRDPRAAPPPCLLLPRACSCRRLLAIHAHRAFRAPLPAATRRRARLLLPRARLPPVLFFHAARLQIPAAALHLRRLAAPRAACAPRPPPPAAALFHRRAAPSAPAAACTCISPPAAPAPPCHPPPSSSSLPRAYLPAAGSMSTCMYFRRAVPMPATLQVSPTYSNECRL